MDYHAWQLYQDSESNKNVLTFRLGLYSDDNDDDVEELDNTLKVVCSRVYVLLIRAFLYPRDIAKYAKRCSGASVSFSSCVQFASEIESSDLSATDLRFLLYCVFTMPKRDSPIPIPLEYNICCIRFYDIRFDYKDVSAEIS